MKAPAYIPEAHRKGVHLLSRDGVAQTGKVSKDGTLERWEHWDGSVDVNVHLKAFRLRLKPENGNDPKVLLLISELEQAIRANEQARASGNEEWHRQTAWKVVDVKRRLEERIANG